MAHPLRAPPLRPMLGAGWAFPVRREAGQDETPAGRPLAMVAEEASVQQSIGVILSTARGERVMRPGFGCDLHRLVLAPNNGATRAQAAFEVREALQAWEPRIDLIDVSVHVGGEVGEQLLIDIEFRVRSTDNRFNLVYPFYLDRPVAS